MNHQTINNNLYIEYEKYLNILSILFEEEKRREISIPLFMYAFPEYDLVERKVMIVGKETNGWFGKLSESGKLDVGKIINEYKGFELGKTYWNTPFWRFSKTFYKYANPKNDLNGLLWSNLSKIDQNQTTPEQDIKLKNIEGYKLLKKEIQITEPDIIIFLTSWKEDDTIRQIFEDAEFKSVENVDSKYLVRIKSDELPHNTFRTYHPRFLNSKRSKFSINEIIEKLCTIMNIVYDG